MREVQLKIKSASHRCEDLELPCDLSCTVKELKQLIKFHYQFHPEVGDQRLIYAGHLLEDSQTLAQVLLPNSEAAQTSFTLHLACTSSFFQSRQKSSSRQETNNDLTPPPPATAQPVSFAQGIPPELLNLHQLYVQQMMAYMSDWSQGRSNSLNWNAAPNQYAAFGNHIGGTAGAPGSSGNSNVPHEGSADPQAAPDVPMEPARVVDNQLVEDVARAAAEAARAANAARVAAARDEEEAPRDVIDWMYTLSRVALIFSVVYFYSNFTRFFLVVILSALVFILQRRPLLWNGRQPAAQEAPNAAPARPVENVAREQARGEERVPDVPTSGGNDSSGEELNSGEAEEAATVDENPVELIPEPQEGARINPRDVTWTFLTTFFTSLIPEIPQN